MQNTTTAARNFAQQFGYDPEDKSEKELQAKRREFVEWKETVWKKHLIEFYQVSRWNCLFMYRIHLTSYICVD